MLSPIERLRSAKALSETVAALGGESDAKRKVVLERRAESLRALLLGRRATSIADLDLFAGQATVDALKGYWAQVNGDRDYAARDMDAADVERIRVARYLKIIARFVDGVNKHASTGSGAGSEGLGQLWAEIHEHDQGQKVEYMTAELDRFVEAGAEVGRALEGMREAARELDEINARDQQRQADLDAAWKEMTQTLSPMRDRALFSKDLAVQNAYNAAHAEFVRKIQERFDPIEDALREERKDATLRYSIPAHELKRAILDDSPVAAAEAADWAAAQRIDPGAVAALKRKGYDPKKVRADIAEFYRLTGGRLSAVKIRASRGRATAQGIHGHNNRVINMGAHFDKRVLFHELGHHLEADPQVYSAARAFLLRRRESPAVYRLSELTGNKGYGPRELAFKDHWFHPYVGKDYSYDVTEVFSMGVESWCDDVTLASRMRADPEHFKLIAGFMKAPPHELFGSVKKVLAQAAEADAEAEEAAEETLEAAVKRLAVGVEFVATDDGEGRRPYWLHSGRYLGRFAHIDAWADVKTRDPRTKRLRKGIVLVHVREEEPGGRVSVQWMPTFSLLEAKASARAWRDTGTPSYLYDYTKVAQLAASLS